MPAAAVEQLPIRTISALTGVNAMTLRAWERRHGLVRPKRTPKGHRLYTHQDVERVRRAQALVARGVPISRVKRLLDANPASEGGRPERGPWQDYHERMAAAISRFDERELDQVYDEALSIHPTEKITQNMILPLLVHLGERWQDLAGAIAEEHFFATYLRSKLGARLQHRMRHASGPRIIAACAPGEKHEIGLLLFALEAQHAGLQTVLLGADTPLAEVAMVQQRCGSQAIVLSSTVAPEPGFLEHGLATLVRKTNVPVFVGGATALGQRKAISAAGAIALGVDLEGGARLISARLSEMAPAT